MTWTAKKIRELFIQHGFSMPEIVQIQRTYAGHWQRSAGAWLWSLDTDDRQFQVSMQNMGSCERAIDLIKAEKTIIYCHVGGIELVTL